jgi:sialic acid synthase SpsE
VADLSQSNPEALAQDFEARTKVPSIRIALNVTHKTDIEFMSTLFDMASAYFLNNLMNVFKISSSNITNTPFI